MHISELTSAQVASALDHSGDWHEARAKAIGGSDATVIAKGVPEAMEALRLQKCGHAASEDLSDVLAVQMGSWSEGLNRYWLSRALGMEIKPGFSVACQTHHFMRANLDGTAADGGLVECKHTNSFTKADDLVPRYYAQLQHCLAVTKAPHIYLSVFRGSDAYFWQKIARDEPYIANLIAAEEAFWSYVIADTPIIEARGVETPVAPEQMRDVDMKASNSWATSAADWLMLKDQAKDFETAAKALKELMAADMGRGHGHGIEITRAKNGALTIKELKAPKLKKEAA